MSFQRSTRKNHSKYNTGFSDWKTTVLHKCWHFKNEVYMVAWRINKFGSSIGHYNLLTTFSAFHLQIYTRSYLPLQVGLTQCAIHVLPSLYMYISWVIFPSLNLHQEPKVIIIFHCKYTIGDISLGIHIMDHPPSCNCTMVICECQSKWKYVLVNLSL